MPDKVLYRMNNSVIPYLIVDRGEKAGSEGKTSASICVRRDEPRTGTETGPLCSGRDVLQPRCESYYRVAHPYVPPWPRGVQWWGSSIVSDQMAGGLYHNRGSQ